MKYIVTISLLAIVALTACKKTSAPAFKANAYIFGVYGGFCSTGCSYYYLVRNGQAFEDSTLMAPTFFAAPLADSNYTLLKPLIDSLPAYLKDHPNNNYICAACADQPIYYVAAINGNDTTKWNIDAMATTPTAVYQYAVQVANALERVHH